MAWPGHSAISSGFCPFSPSTSSSVEKPLSSGPRLPLPPTEASRVKHVHASGQVQTSLEAPFSVSTSCSGLCCTFAPVTSGFGAHSQQRPRKEPRFVGEKHHGECLLQGRSSSVPLGYLFPSTRSATSKLSLSVLRKRLLQRCLERATGLLSRPRCVQHTRPSSAVAGLTRPRPDTGHEDRAHAAPHQCVPARFTSGHKTARTFS